MTVLFAASQPVFQDRLCKSLRAGSHKRLDRPGEL